jgi:hypothetical protein
VGSNATSIGDIPVDFDTDTDVFPWLVPEPGLSDQTYFGSDVLDEDVFGFTNQEVDTNVPEFWEEQNTGNDTDLGSSTCMGGINPAVLDPFQTIGTSPLPLNLVSSANKYCEFQPISIATLLQLTCIISFINIVARLDAKVIHGYNSYGRATMVCQFCVQRSTP